MKDIVELKVTVARMESITLNMRVSGLIFRRILLTKKVTDVVTDRLVVSDEGVRVLDVRE